MLDGYAGFGSGTFEHELKAAAAVQQSLLPESAYASATCTAAGMSLPCRAVGGDFFDYVDRDAGQFGFIVADVSGKGPGAALVAATVAGIFSVEAAYQASTAAVVKRLNSALLVRNVEPHFLTAFYGMLGPDGSLTYVNAGHNSPVLMTAHGMRTLDSGGMALGLFADAGFTEETVRLDPGDCVVAFSDGITEARNDRGEEFSEARVLECLEECDRQDPRILLEALSSRVEEFSADQTPVDDMTIVVVRYRGPGAPGLVTPSRPLA